MELHPNHDIAEMIFSATNEPALNDKELTRDLSAYINQLLIHDFERLVSLLYRIDVNERKLRLMLKENSSADAGEVIAALIIERQLQKIRNRQDYRKDNSDTGDDKW